jgi:hypothetical protein
MKRLLLLPLLLVSLGVHAIVIRDDVPDEEYRVEASAFPALVDLPHEGHGVLIAPQWVLTAAHATQWHPITAVMLNGECLPVEQVIVHPGYLRLPESLTSGDAEPAMRFLAGSDDIALIKLAKPVSGTKPVALYSGHAELGKPVVLFGKGATGNGRSGQMEGSNRTELRRAENVVSAVQDRWLVYGFQPGPPAPRHLGILGNGDSGGPVLLRHNGRWELAGLASWKYATGSLASFHPGLYGQQNYQVRVSHYLAWIRAVLAGGSKGAGPNNSSKPTPLRGAA